MSEATLELFGNTLFWPLLTSIATAAIGGLLLAGRPSCGASRVAATALFAGAALGLVLVHDGFRFPPARSPDRLLPLLALVWLLGSFGPGLAPRRGRATTLIGAALLIGVALLWLLWPLLLRWPPQNSALVLLTGGALWALLWYSARHGAQRDYGASCLLAPLAMTAPVVAIDGSLLIGQFAGVLAATLGGWWLYSLLRAPCALGGPGSDLVAFALAAVLAMAYFYAGLDLPALLLLALSPLVGVVLAGVLQALTVWQSRILAGLACALPGSLALWWVWPQESLY